MDYDIQSFMDFFFAAIKAFYASPVMMVIKILAGIYLVILTVNIILLLKFRDMPSALRTGLKGMDMPIASKNNMLKRWKKVKDRLKKNDPSQYKVAIIEADAIAESMLDGIGYKGANMAEKLEQVKEGQLDSHLEALKNVHQIRNRIVHEAGFEIDEATAKATIEVYEKFLRYLEFLD